MPELVPQSTPPPVTPSSRIDPAAWEDFPVFRETFLRYFTRPADAAALRAVGRMAYDLVLEAWGNWPDPPEGFIARDLYAALADVRHLQGFLRTLGNQQKDSSLSRSDAALSRYAAIQSGKLRTVANNMDARLARVVG